MGIHVRFTLELRRNSKKFHDVGAPKRLAYQHDGHGWVPLPHADGALVLGIAYDHFIKTVIIPQGRFQETRCCHLPGRVRA